MNNVKVGEYLAALRKYYKITQDELAERLQQVLNIKKRLFFQIRVKLLRK